jgi:hypothetical protein
VTRQYIDSPHVFYRYFSPYPVTESESDGTVSVGAGRRSSLPVQPASDEPSARSGPGKPSRGTSGNKSLHRTTLRSHGRTADMLAGGLNRDISRDNGQPNILWVCDRCFKYMNEGVPYEIHAVCVSSSHSWCILTRFNRRTVSILIHLGSGFGCEVIAWSGRLMGHKRKWSLIFFF